MERSVFSSLEALKYGIRVTKDKIGFYLALGSINGLSMLGVTVFLALLGIVASLLTYKFIPSECEIPLAILQGSSADPTNFICLSGVWLILRLSAFIFSIIREFFSLGWIKIALEEYDVGFSSYQKLFSMSPLLFRSVIASLVYYSAVVIGLFLFVVPGLYVATRLYFYKYALVDQNVSSIEALKMSYNLTQDNFWSLFGFATAVFFINWLGFLFFGIGWFFTYPVITLAQAYVFRKLQINLVYK